MTYLVLKDEEGILRPLAFISPNNEAGQYRAKIYKLNKGEQIVRVDISEI